MSSLWFDETCNFIQLWIASANFKYYQLVKSLRGGTIYSIFSQLKFCIIVIVKSAKTIGGNQCVILPVSR